jgi:5-methylcytosine-specific restriction endonuclease McrA
MISNKQKRSLRLAAAREKGTHSKEEWEALKVVCGFVCVSCKGESGLINIEKDHIVPIYQGGSDAIDNLQPSCAKCNSSKGSDCTDYRPADWRDRLNALL